MMQCCRAFNALHMHCTCIAYRHGVAVLRTLLQDPPVEKMQHQSCASRTSKLGRRQGVRVAGAARCVLAYWSWKEQNNKVVGGLGRRNDRIWWSRRSAKGRDETGDSDLATSLLTTKECCDNRIARGDEGKQDRNGKLNTTKEYPDHGRQRYCSVALTTEGFYMQHYILLHQDAKRQHGFNNRPSPGQAPEPRSAIYSSKCRPSLNYSSFLRSFSKLASSPSLHITSPPIHQPSIVLLISLPGVRCLLTTTSPPPLHLPLLLKSPLVHCLLPSWRNNDPSLVLFFSLPGVLLAIYPPPNGATREG